MAGVEDAGEGATWWVRVGWQYVEWSVVFVRGARGSGGMAEREERRGCLFWW